MGKGKIFILVVLSFANLLVWYAYSVEARNGELTVTFIDVGQGDAIFIDSPGGEQVLIDTGRDDDLVIRRLAEVMPFYDRTIDIVIATHPDGDHIGGLPSVLDSYLVSLYIEPEVVTDSAIDALVEEKIKEYEIPKLIAKSGMTIPLGDEVKLEVLFPDMDVSGFDSNAASVITKLTYGDTSFLLTGDAPKEMEDYTAGILGDYVDVDVLKVGHHGSKTSTSDFFVNATSPAIAIISAGEGNSFGHPHESVLDTLSRFNVKTLTTAKEGNIVLRSDGDQIFLD